jgi:hypothetical protein
MSFIYIALLERRELISPSIVLLFEEILSLIHACVGRVWFFLNLVSLATCVSCKFLFVIYRDLVLLYIIP